jgi:hypothetical protein
MCAARVSESDFCTWLSRAVAGDAITYHQGFLACDTNCAVSILPAGERIELAHVARSARWAAEEGLVHLLQRRLAPEQFAYVAIARPRPRLLPDSRASPTAQRTPNTDFQSKGRRTLRASPTPFHSSKAN